MANSDVWINYCILGAHVGMSIWIVGLGNVSHHELSSFGFVVDILDSIILLVDAEGTFSSWDLKYSFIVPLSKGCIFLKVNCLVSKYLARSLHGLQRRDSLSKSVSLTVIIISICLVNWLRVSTID